MFLTHCCQSVRLERIADDQNADTSRNRPQPGPHGRAPVAAAYPNPAFDAGSDMPVYEEMDGASGQQGGFGGPGYDGLATTPPGDALYGGDSTYDAAPASATVYRVPDPLPPDGALGESYEDIGPTGRCNDCNAKMKFCVCRVRRSTADMPTLRKARARKGDPTQQCTYKKGACRSKQSASPGAYCTNHSCTSCSGPKRSSEESCGSCDAGRGRSATLQRPRTNATSANASGPAAASDDYDMPAADSTALGAASVPNTGAEVTYDMASASGRETGLGVVFDTFDGSDFDSDGGSIDL